MAVGLRAAGNIKIANLTITNCNIERLYGDVFRWDWLLISLFPIILCSRSNNIVKLIIEDTPIRDIADDTFVGVGDFLQEFSLVNSRLNTFPQGALKSLTAIKKIVIDKRWQLSLILIVYEIFSHVTFHFQWLGTIASRCFPWTVQAQDHPSVQCKGWNLGQERLQWSEEPEGAESPHQQHHCNQARNIRFWAGAWKTRNDIYLVNLSS